jgi:hypothetical protein
LNWREKPGIRIEQVRPCQFFSVQKVSDSPENIPYLRRSINRKFIDGRTDYLSRLKFEKRPVTIDSVEIKRI